MSEKLTQFQENFCREYIKTGNASAAYRAVSPKAATWQEKSVWEKASQMMARVKVESRIAELQAAGAYRAVVSLESLGAELDKGIVQAFETANTAAYFTGVLGKAKLFGFLVDKKEIRTGGLDNLEFDQLKHIDELIAATIAGRAEHEPAGPDDTTH